MNKRKLLAIVVVNIAWCIPGPPHRWARMLKAERRAGQEAMLRAAKEEPPAEAGGKEETGHSGE